MTEEDKTPIKKISYFKCLFGHKKPTKWQVGETLDNITWFNLKPILIKYGMTEGSKIIAEKIRHHVKK